MGRGRGKRFSGFEIIDGVDKRGGKKKMVYVGEGNMVIDERMGEDFKGLKKFMRKVSCVGEGEEKID